MRDLERAVPGHPFLVTMAGLKEGFDKAASQFSVPLAAPRIEAV